MKRSLITLLALSFILQGCEELSFKTNQNTSDDTTNSSESEPSNDFTDTSEVNCSGSYPIKFSQVENSTNSDSVGNLEKLIDKKKTNDFAWDSNDKPNELIFQLEQKSQIKDIVISWQEQMYSHYYDIDISFDKQNWTSLISAGQSTEGNIFAERLALSNKAHTGNFIKLTLNGNSLNNSNDISEFEVYGCYKDTSHSIELIDWYLSVQTDEDENGKSDSIKETDLQNGYEDPRFFYVSEDQGLVFTSSVNGYRTSTNTKYVRSELREMLRRGNTSHKTQGVNKNNWVFSSAPLSDQQAAGGVDGELTAKLAVNHVTSTGEDYQIGRVIIGQIHANDDEPVRLYYRKLPQNNNGSIYIAHEFLEGDDHYYEIIGSRDNDADNPVNGIPLNEKFAYQIAVKGNELIVSITKADGTIHTVDVDMSRSGYDVGGQYMYFKAGVYNQNNSGNLHDYVQATFYQIDNNHDTY